ncbi:hypothetical protein [Dyadobacter frigoris]|uniref:Uncharacterized protein n=1 Tax=Dyadobacter frigoris TaxID=2576211 RepID=A0A4U6D260_9BACT|nr:hypothetical protein [Dyadobacter frigoris]TKT90141.1 hypothetical protein FDK13_20595 [Dyadobacter frigoris]
MTKKNTVTIHRIITILPCLFLLLSNSWGQSIPKADFEFPVIREQGIGYDLKGWLEKHVLSPRENECKPTWGVFYFKVNALGKIDSLANDGNLRSAVSERIVKNIYSTEGHWIISNTNKSIKSQLFIFLYFDYGGAFYGDNSCPEEFKLLQQTVMSISETLSKAAIVANGGRGTVIGPSLNGGGYIKM